MDRYDDDPEIKAIEAEIAALPDEEAAQPGEAPPEPEESLPAEEQPEPVEAPEEPAESQDEPEAEQPKENRTVPYQALYAEREKRKALEAELVERRKAIDEMRGEVTALKETFTSIATQREEAKKAQEAEAAKPKRMAEVEVPSWDDDPRAHMEAINKNAAIREHNLRIDLEEKAAAEAARLVSERMAPIEKAYGDHQALTAEQVERATLLQNVDSLEQTYALEQPDYYAAINAYKTALQHEKRILGKSPQEASKLVQAEMEAQAKQWLGDRVDPAQAWYALATFRGWKPNGSQPQVDTQTAPQPQAAQRPTAPAKPKPQGKPSAETVARGMASSDGLAQVSGSGGGNVNDPEATLAEYLKMSDEEFAASEAKINAILAQADGMR